MFDIIVCGSNTVDVFVETDAELIRFSGIDHGHATEQNYVAYPLGTKIPMKKLEFHIGGGGTNLLATFAAQKLKCAYIGKIGDGTNGHLVYNWLKNNKITFLGQVGGTTGYAVILDSQADDRTILLNKGANDTLNFTDIPKHNLSTKWFYGTSMHGESFETLEKLFVFMRNHGVKTVFNPNCNVLMKGIGHVKNILSYTDILILNKEEAHMISPEESTSAGLAEQMMSSGPKIVVVTDGANGATIHVCSRWDGKEEAWHVAPAKNRKVIETTGAGDAFGSGFVSGLAQGKNVHSALLMAIFNAESVISACGTKEHVLSRKETDSALMAEKKKSRHKVTKIKD